MATAPERLAAIETTVKLIKWILALFIPVLIGWGAYVTVNVISLKQAVTDGSTKLVTELKSPKSPAQLQANLTTLNAQIQTAKLDGIKPDQKKVISLSSAVSEVIDKNPELPEAWQTAGELISYRTVGNKSETPCPGPSVMGFLENHGDFGPNIKTIVALAMKNCTVDLNQTFSFMSAPEYLRVADRPEVRVALVLDNVHVVYHGGTIMPINEIVCRGCTFEFQMYTVPPAPGKSIVKNLLVASDSGNAKITIPATAG